MPRCAGSLQVQYVLFAGIWWQRFQFPNNVCFGWLSQLWCHCLLRVVFQLSDKPNITARHGMQASDVPEAVAATMSKAPSLARRLVDATLQQYNLRLQVALQALARAGGPLSPLVHLSVQVMVLECPPAEYPTEYMPVMQRQMSRKGDFQTLEPLTLQTVFSLNRCIHHFWLCA